MRQLQNFIAGAWVGSEGPRFRSVDPYRGDDVAEAGASTPSEVEAAITAARSSFDDGSWSQRRGAERARALLALADAMETHEREVGELVAREMGKPIRVARGREVGGSIDRLRYAAGIARSVEGRVIATVPNELWDMEVPEPVGVCALIIPWNDPIDLAVRKLGTALAIGCTVVVKPSEVTPASTSFLIELAADIGAFPDGVINLVQGPGDPTGEALVSSAGVDKISFTGSTETGRHIMKAAAERLTKVSLECGGKAAAVVFADADLDRCADALTYGAFMYSGQSCTACTRLIVEDAVHDDLVDRMVERSRSLPTGDPLDPANLVGPMASRKQYDKAVGFLRRGLAEGGRPVLGGDEGGDDLFLPPTILVDVAADAEVAREEIFGPILAVHRFKEPEEALALANATPYGLGGSVWSRDINRALGVTRSLDVADVWINTYYVRNAETSFGGRHLSGIGRELGRAGVQEYLTWKRVCVDTRTMFHLKEWFDRGEDFRG